MRIFAKTEAKTIFALFHIAAYFNDFYTRITSVVKAHLHNWCLLLRFCPENTAWTFSEPRLKRSKFYNSPCKKPHMINHMENHMINHIENHIINHMINHMIFHIINLMLFWHSESYGESCVVKIIIIICYKH